MKSLGGFLPRSSPLVLQIFHFAQELQGVNDHVKFQITSKGNKFATSAAILHEFRPFNFYHQFANTAHFFSKSLALLQKLTASEPLNHAGEKTYFKLPPRVGHAK